MTNRGEIFLPSSFESVGLARDLVRATIDGAAPHELIDDIVLVTSELVTNAIEHGKGDVELSVARIPDAVTLSVSSDSTSLPVPSSDATPVDALSGRGLLIVAALSSEVAIIGEGERVRVECRFAVG